MPATAISVLFLIAALGCWGLGALRRSRKLAIAAGVFGTLFLGSVVLLVLVVAGM
jgi:hypothetical protein